MFNSEEEDIVSSSQVITKKTKPNKPFSSHHIHSSLGYTPFKAPPLVEYNSIDSYCEKKLGKTRLPSPRLDPQSSLSMVMSISSPIVLKGHDQPTENVAMVNSDFVPPHTFYSVEELSLIRSLVHWSHTKVCPVGRVEFDAMSQQCYLHSVLEKGSWTLLLDTSLLKEIPTLKTPLQIFGCMEVDNEIPILKLHFYRNLRSADLNLFISSYRMMQKFVPKFMNPSKTSVTDDKGPLHPSTNSGASCGLNDTLDSYNLSVIEQYTDFELRKNVVTED